MGQQPWPVVVLPLQGEWAQPWWEARVREWAQGEAQEEAQEEALAPPLAAREWEAARVRASVLLLAGQAQARLSCHRTGAVPS
jgi:hypothetical protein